MPWDLPRIQKFIRDSNRTFSEHDLCTAPWEPDTTDIVRENYEWLNHPFGYRKSKIISCSDEGRLSVRLRNLNKRGESYKVHDNGTVEVFRVKEWRNGVRIFCYLALNIAEELRVAIDQDRILIEDHVRQEKTGEAPPPLQLNHFSKGDGKKEYLANEDFEVVGVSWWSDDLTWQVVIARELKGCPEKGKVDPKKKWKNYVEFSDAREIPGFYASEDETPRANGD